MRKIWWATAPVAVALMLAASSQPYFSLYKGWGYDAEQVVPASGGNFSMPANEWDVLPEMQKVDARHEAHVEVLGFQPVVDNAHTGIYPPEGFTTWVVMTQWDAPTDSILKRCEMWVTGSDGVEYHRNDLVFTGAKDPHFDSGYSCTPPREEGPYQSLDNGEIVVDDPRPESWKKLSPFALPDGVQPLELHIAWAAPHYATIVLPEPAVFFPPEEASEADASSGE